MEKPDSAWNFLKRKNKAQSEGGIGYGSFRWGIGTHGLTGAGGTGDEHMRKLADIPHDAAAADVLALVRVDMEKASEEQEA